MTGVVTGAATGGTDDGTPWRPRDVAQVGFDVRVGTDVQPIAEIERSLVEYGPRYLRRLFTDHEIASCGGADAPAQVLAPGLAARFAAKEATLKVLRPTRDVVPLWTEIEVVRAPEGWTDLALFGQSADMAREAGLALVRLTLTHGGGIAVATVVGIIQGGTQVGGNLP